MKIPKWLSNTTFFSSLRELREEVLEAKEAQVESQIARMQARAELSKARKVARQVEYINARNHFSESIPDALLGRSGNS